MERQKSFLVSIGEVRQCAGTSIREEANLGGKPTPFTPQISTYNIMTPSRGIGGGSSPLSLMFALSLVVVDAFVSPSTTFTVTTALKNSRRWQQQHSLLALLNTPSTFPSTTKTSSSSLAMAQRMTPTRKTRKEDSFDRSSGGNDDDDDYEQEGETMMSDLTADG